jgi:hypothetical protein
MAGKHRIQCDRNAAGQTDLSTVGVPVEKQVKIGVRGLLIYFRCMRQENRKAAQGDSRRGLLNIVDPIKMGVIDAGEIRWLSRSMAW